MPGDVLSSDDASKLYDQLELSSSRVRVGERGMLASNLAPRLTTRAGIRWQLGETITRDEAIGVLEQRIRELETVIAGRGGSNTAMQGAVHLQQTDPGFASETFAMLEEMRQTNANLVILQEQAQRNAAAVGAARQE